ncbi:unnamed protein product [Malus baccata var. baccata]
MHANLILGSRFGEPTDSYKGFSASLPDAAEYIWWFKQQRWRTAPRAWYDKLHNALHSLGFQGSQSDHSLFIKSSPTPVFILVYVDDILVTGPLSAACQQVITQLSALFPIKDLGALHYFLGIEVKISSSGLFISQTKYILDLLAKAKMEGAKPCSTPLSTTKLDHLSPLLENASEYRSLVGALQYPKGSLDLGLWFSKSFHVPSIQAFSDADWAGCSLDKRSTGGYCVYFGNSLISWSAKKQPTVAHSSTEAEYRSLANTAAEITWICKLLADISYSLPHSPKIWCDNLSAISLAKNPIFHARTKHVEIDYHYIREKVLANQVSVQFICTQDQVADICTKSLSQPRFILLRDKLQLRVPQSRLRGDIKDKNVITPSRDNTYRLRNV